MKNLSKITLTNVCRSYDFGRVRVLKDINFEVNEGERIGVIGENGAGKTTLLRILAGVLRASSGEVSIQGDVHAALTLGIGLREERSGRENLQTEAEIHGYEPGEIPSLVGRMAVFADIGDFIDRPVQTYSSGMKSRLTFAFLVISQPEILLIDETLSAGDHFFQPKAKEAIADLCQRGKVVILVSHSMAVIRDMCSRCIWIQEGRIAMDGDVFAVTQAYEKMQLHKKEEQITTNMNRVVSRLGNQQYLKSLSLLSLGKDVTGEVLIQKQPLCLMIQLQEDADFVDQEISVSIEQLDGAPICGWKIDPVTIFSEQTKAGSALYLEMGEIPLEKGMYVLQSDVNSACQTIEDSISMLLTVDTKKTYVGGSPMISSDYVVECFPI